MKCTLTRKNLPKLLRQWRARNELTIDQAACLLQLGRRTICYYESGEKFPNNPLAIHRLSELLKTFTASYKQKQRA